MMRRIVYIFFIALSAFALFASTADARKIRTKLPAAKVTPADVPESAGDGRIILSRDSSEVWKDTEKAIRFYGFDKTAASGVESFFIINGLDSTITKMGVNILYLDMKGRELHRRECFINCTIPPKETRRVDVKTWDLQKSFYYHKSAAPKRQATPFDVKIELSAVEF